MKGKRSMDLKELFAVLREQGISEVTFKIGQANPEYNHYWRKQKRQVVSVEEKPDLTPAQDAPSNDQVAKFRNRYPDYRPESTTMKKAKVDKAARVDAFKKENPNYFTIAEMAAVCEVGEMLIRRFITEQTAFKKVGKVKYYKLDDVYDNRIKYENDILIHDGSRPGNSKFIADRLLELLK